MYYNPLDSFYKSQIGAVCANKQITFRVKGEFGSVVFVYRKDGENIPSYHRMQKIENHFELTIKFGRGLYYYYFQIDESQFISANDDFQGIITCLPKEFQLTAYDESYVVPDWVYGSVIYQIFPDRFCRAEEKKMIESYKVLHQNWLETPVYEPDKNGKIVNNDFFGGDIKGIISKIEYLSQIGVSIIYLNPIFRAFSNHRYDTGDYMQIDPLLGSEKDLINLINIADSYGIKIVLDGVFNHTGDDSLYFNKYGRYDSLGAYQSKQSKYFNWYNFIEYPNKYDAWWGIETLPAINEHNQEYVNFITGDDGVLEHYTKLGIGGWRLDVVDELPTEFVRKIRTAIKRINKDALIIGEVWEDVSNKIAYGVRREYFQGFELDSAMNYPLKEAIIDFVKNGNSLRLSRTIKEQIDHYPHKSLHAMMNLLSTHDTMRLITVLGGENPCGMTKKQMAEYSIPNDKINYAKNALKSAALLQFTLCGVPSIYYGDEIGMQGYADPLNRRTYPWGNEDKELLEWYKFLGALRQNYSAFKTGSFNEVYCSHGVYIYSRQDDFSEVLIAVNVSDKDVCFSFDGALQELISSVEYVEEYTLKGHTNAVFINKMR